MWRCLRSWGARGSLAIAAVPVLCTSSALWFSLAYPYDYIAVLNPRYLLSQVMPMSACLAVALADLESVALRRSVRAVPARILLSMTSIPTPHDAADALALAICHFHHAGIAEKLKRATRKK